MKKLLFLIIASLFSLGTLSVSAQTFGINTFCQPLSKSGATAGSLGISSSVFKKMLSMKSDQSISASLLKAGFSCISKKIVREYDEPTGDYYTILKAKYSKAVAGGGKIFVIQDGCDVTITFPNMAEKNKFLKTVNAEKSKGYIYSSEKYYWVGVRVESASNSYTVRVVGNGGY